MKTKILILLLSACCLLSCTDGLWNAIEDLNKKYENLDDRVSRLEELCKEMNTNIAALQTLVKVMLGNDYIVSITPIMKEDKEIGYVITFAIHDPITIYHGQDGADGKDGKDGQDGVTPLISVALDSTDNAYYWTLNGDWLLDANGNRIPLTSRDGRDGQDGQDGADGITPQLKIENGYWYVSTDNGVTWTQLGKATGENGRDGVDGQDGRDGQDGADGDSMFQSVTQDDNFVYFTLANGTILKISKYNDDSVQIVDGAIMAAFSVSDTTKVYFSQGNLMYSQVGTHLCADGTTKTGTWRFAEDQVSFGDGFYWGDSGFRASVHTSESSYASFFQNYLTELTQNISGTNYDWGQYNAIENGGDIPNIYRTLTNDEWDYLLNTRPNSDKLKGTLHVFGLENTVFGYILPDTWDINILIPETLYLAPQLYDTYPELKKIEDKGCVIFRYGEQGLSHYYTSSYGSGVYNSSTNYHYSCYTIYGANNVGQSYFTYYGASATSSSKTDRAIKNYVRLVKDVE